jgi:adenosylhomocysteine nucleosidase
MTAEFSPEDIKNNFSNLENINLHIVYTGIGKANAARALQEKISKLQEVDLVVNFGTAGGRNLSPGVYFGTELYEGDMKQEALGLPNGVNLNSNFEYKGENKKEAWTGQKIELSNPFKNIKSAKCVTRDAFVNDKPPIKEASHSLEEMEAHPLAVTCIQNNISFFPIKRVSNAIGGSTSSKEQGKEFSQDLLKHNQQNPFIAILRDYSTCSIRLTEK